jgi:hypothetical protein
LNIVSIGSKAKLSLEFLMIASLPSDAALLISKSFSGWKFVT